MILEWIFDRGRELWSMDVLVICRNWGLSVVIMMDDWLGYYSLTKYKQYEYICIESINDELRDYMDKYTRDE